jgi:hypothetical protein
MRQKSKSYWPDKWLNIAYKQVSEIRIFSPFMSAAFQLHVVTLHSYEVLCYAGEFN